MMKILRIQSWSYSFFHYVVLCCLRCHFMQLALTIFLPEVLRAIAGFRISLVVLFARKRKLLSSDFSLVISAVPSLFWPFEEGQRQRDYGDLGGFVQGAARRKHLPCSDHSRPLRRGIGLHADAQGGAGARSLFPQKPLSFIFFTPLQWKLSGFA